VVELRKRRIGESAGGKTRRERESDAVGKDCFFSFSPQNREEGKLQENGKSKSNKKKITHDLPLDARESDPCSKREEKHFKKKITREKAEARCRGSGVTAVSLRPGLPRFRRADRQRDWRKEQKVYQS